MKALLGLAALLLAGCSVSALDPKKELGPAPNQCSSDGDCAGGLCIAERCEAPVSQITQLLFEITPASRSGRFTGVPFLKTVALPANGDRRLDLSLTEVALVRGSARLDPESECSELGTHNGTVPTRLTFIPTERLLGLPAATYTAETVLDLETNQYTFELRLPPGKYDWHVQPLVESTTKCPLVSQLYVDQSIDASPNQKLEFVFPKPQPLRVMVRLPLVEAQDFAGWRVDVLDPQKGKVISNESRLAVSPEVTDALEYTAQVWYAPVTGGDAAALHGQEVIRLRPPEDGSPAPTLLMVRAVVELFAPGEAVIDQITALPKLITVQGRVEAPAAGDSSVPQPVPADVTLTSEYVADIPSGVTASYTQRVSTDEDGNFTVSLLRGKYRVYTEPKGSSALGLCSEALSTVSPAATVDTWDIRSDQSFQAGRTIPLNPSPAVRGRVLAPLGRDVLPGASVQAIPSACSSSVGSLLTEKGATQVAPRASGTLSCTDGSFALGPDPGVFNLSTRPAVETGMPWMVWANVNVSPMSDTNLGDTLLPLPVVYQGQVTVPIDPEDPGAGTQPIQGASIRAYAFVGPRGLSNSERGSWVVQVAESQVGSNGEFELLVPAHINAPSEPSADLPASCR